MSNFYALTFYEGETWRISGILGDSNSVSIPLTDGSVDFKVGDYEVPATITDEATGQWAIDITPTDQINNNLVIPEGEESAVFPFEVRASLANGFVTVQNDGTITIRDSIFADA